MRKTDPISVLSNDNLGNDISEGASSSGSLRCLKIFAQIKISDMDGRSWTS